MSGQKGWEARPIELSDNARTILEKRYLRRLDGQPVEQPEDMFLRVARVIAAVDGEVYGRNGSDVDDLAHRFYELFAARRFMPNSPTLMNAGRELGQLSACFVLPIEDSMEGIFDTLKAAALIHQSGGGTGFSFSRLRPKDDIVASTGGSASGPLSFLKVYNAATEAVKQGGTRRGANMGVLRVDHPDIMAFIEAKRQEGEISNFNLSIAATDEFMEAVRNKGTYPLVNPHTGQVAGELDAGMVFDKLSEMAWLNGEPGVVFIDRINAQNPTPHVGTIESTNPCGEQPLLPFESCNLGSINLGAVAVEGPDGSALDYAALGDTVHLAVHFLDNVIDASRFPLPEIARMTRANRKIGLGVMGFADLLVRLGIPYDSNEAVELAGQVMAFIQREAQAESRRLAEERGAYPNFPGSALDQAGRPPVRNATVTTIAPTGTISTIAGCSSGIEPYFALAYERHVLGGHTLTEVVPLVEERLAFEGLDAARVLGEVIKTGKLAGVPGVPQHIADLFKTSLEIAPQWHLAIQAEFQKHTDNAVSKTINLPHETTMADIREILMRAYDLGCKGITVYRDGSRSEQVLSAGVGHEQTGHFHAPRPRPDVLSGTTQKFKVGCGNLYVTVNSDECGVSEVFTNTGREGGCASQSEATSRLLSIALRSGVPANALVEQIRGIRCPACIRRDGVKVTSCPDALGRALAAVVKTSGGVIAATAEQAASHNGQCPECGEPMIMESGCHICKSCGYSKCG